MLEQARKTLEIEAQAVLGLKERLGDDFIQAVELLRASKGKAVVTGVGKSGAIGRKLASTLASTGTPGFFLHPAEAVHGDLGTVSEDDVVIALSLSGETEEIVRLLPHLKRVGAKIIALCGRLNSTLAQESDCVLDVSVSREACPLNLAPTASAAAMLAMGDALAMAIMQANEVSLEDFAASHPAGALGKKLLRARDVMHSGDDNPTARPEMLLREVLPIMTASPLRGVVSIIGDGGELLGVFTDGDLRRLLDSRGGEVLELPIAEVMTKSPTVVREGQLAAEVARLFQETEFDNVPVVDEQGRAVGVIDVQDMLKAGLV
ncbi:MAG: SIS domain-containing protein [Armatimonadota bacterium]